MSSFGVVLRILGLIVTGALALFYTFVVGSALIGMVAAGAASNGVGGLLGALLADLVFIAVFIRILRSLRAR